MTSPNEKAVERERFEQAMREQGAKPEEGGPIHDYAWQAWQAALAAQPPAADRVALAKELKDRIDDALGAASVLKYVDRDGMHAAIDRLAAPPQTPAAQLVAQQAEDAGLWFKAENAAEAYLQQELRRLHAAVEASAAEAAPEQPSAEARDAALRDAAQALLDVLDAHCAHHPVSPWLLQHIEALRAALAQRNGPPKESK